MCGRFLKINKPILRRMMVLNLLNKIPGGEFFNIRISNFMSDFLLITFFQIIFEFYVFHISKISMARNFSEVSFICRQPSRDCLFGRIMTRGIRSYMGKYFAHFLKWQSGHDGSLLTLAFDWENKAEGKKWWRKSALAASLKMMLGFLELEFVRCKLNYAGCKVIFEWRRRYIYIVDGLDPVNNQNVANSYFKIRSQKQSF